MSKLNLVLIIMCLLNSWLSTLTLAHWLSKKANGLGQDAGRGRVVLDDIYDVGKNLFFLFCKVGIIIVLARARARNK